MLTEKLLRKYEKRFFKISDFLGNTSGNGDYIQRPDICGFLTTCFYITVKMTRAHRETYASNAPSLDLGRKAVLSQEQAFPIFIYGRIPMKTTVRRFPLRLSEPLIEKQRQPIHSYLLWSSDRCKILYRLVFSQFYFQVHHNRSKGHEANSIYK